ncbi:MAG: T9SS type A sorting domain-containing protein [Bacteroidetes bacterium]|nr:T9SS type A sorting domain-containing protein [Bacteroidota bacterium]
MKKGICQLLVLLALSFFGCQDEDSIQFTRSDEAESQSGAGLSMDHWAAVRSWPDGKIHSSRFYEGFLQKKATEWLRGPDTFDSEWEGIGPKNFGGRTLCMAFHPDDSNTLFVGSAGGGLWKTTTAGIGAAAWDYVSTGFPVIGVGAIAINPDNPDVMYIGTGEVYNYNAAKPGVVDRFTRGSYGIGILKTNDGGNTWEKSLDWSQQEMTGIQDIVINPDRPETIYAATSLGLYRSYDAGNSWVNIQNIDMAVDIEMHPLDTSTIIVSFGNLNSPQQGVYRSTNGGDTFTLLDSGLPTNYSGKTLLSYSENNPDILYASVADATGVVGLFRSDNGGDSWGMVNNTNVPSYQGWYSHDIAINPQNPEYIIWVGVDGYLSTDGGSNLTQVSYWYLWDLGQTPVGGPEGPSDYVHADIHAVYFHPQDPTVVYAVTDGGIFYSGDQGQNWEGRNGGYQTQQFYADFGYSRQDSLFGIGGLQDNASAMYIGDDAWVRILGGDGMTGAVHPENDSIVLASYYYLNVSRSVDRGGSFYGLNIASASSENKAFNAPFAFAPGISNRIYGGAESLHRSDDLGATWQATSTQPVESGNLILTLGLTDLNTNLIYVATVPGSGVPRVKKSLDGGNIWTNMTGLPDRICSDIVIDPLDEQTVYLTFSGYGTEHIYKTTDGGISWTASGAGLPDVPGNCLFVDPENNEILYYGNDLGVYVSFDAGASWEPFADGLPDAIMVMHLVYSPSNRKLILASHGHGVYAVDLFDFPVSQASEIVGEGASLELYPNPVTDRLFVSTDKWEGITTCSVYSMRGELIRRESFTTPYNQIEMDVSTLSSGMYVLECMDSEGKRLTSTFVKQ